MTGALDWLSLLPWVGCLSVQVQLWRQARRLARQVTRTDFESLTTQLCARIAAHARRSPRAERAHALDELDRWFEVIDDRLRTLAAAQLASGLGATVLGLLVAGAWMMARAETPTWRQLLQAVGYALAGSLSGVVFHLVVVLRLLRAAEDCFADARQAAVLRLDNALEAAATVRAPRARALKRQLRALATTLARGLGEALAAGVGGLPEVVARLQAGVGTFTTALDAHTRAGTQAAVRLDACAERLGAVTEGLPPLADRLAGAAERLDTLPVRVGTALETVAGTWSAAARTEREEHVALLIGAHARAVTAGTEREERLLDAGRELRAAVADVRAAVEQLPTAWARGIADAADRLGVAFGQEARQFTLDTEQRLLAAYERLGERVADNDRRSRANVDTLVSEIAERLWQTVGQAVAAQVRAAADSLRDGAERLPAAARALTSEHTALLHARTAQLERWEAAGRQVDQAAQRLAGWSGEVAQVAQSVAGTAAQALRLAERGHEFTATLRSALEEAHRSQLARLEELVRGLLDDARGAQLEARRLVDRQGDVIRRCLSTLVDGAAPDEPAART